MMKLCYLLLIFCLYTNQGWGQSLQGIFLPNYGKNIISFEYEALRFKGTHFDYYMSSCTGNYFGKGTYTLHADTLRLHFEANGAEASIRAQHCATHNTAPQYCFHVIDATTQRPIADASVISKDFKYGASTNEAGDAILAYTPASIDSIAVSAIGYTRVFIPITEQINQGYVVALCARNHISAGTEYIYTVSNLHDTGFVIKHFPTMGYHHEVVYKRETGQKAEKIWKATE